MTRGVLRAGTSGYSYKEWKGSFYPEKAPAKEFLTYYATRLATVEINNTYYRFPRSDDLQKWCDQTPEDFVFAVKANMRITHRLRLKGVAQVTRDFVERCQVLGERLGPVLFQLPPQFPRDDERLDVFLEELPAGTRYAMEFRHGSWLDSEVYEKLRDASVAWVVSEDEKVEPPRELTAPYTYVRLRKEEYTDAELNRWRQWVEDCLAQGVDVYLYIKHDEDGTSPERVLSHLGGMR